MRRTGYITLIALSIIFIALSCSKQIQERRAFKDCKFGLHDVHIKQVGLGNVSVDLDIIVANPNETNAVLDRLDFKVYGNNEHIADGVHEEKTEIPPYEKAHLYISVDAKNKSVGKVLLGALLVESLTIRMEGTAYMDTWIGTIEYGIDMEKEVH